MAVDAAWCRRPRSCLRYRLPLRTLDAVTFSSSSLSDSRPAADPPAFALVVMTSPAAPLRPAVSAASLVEIAIGEVSMRISGAVDAEVLVAVLRAVRRAS